MNNHDVVYTIRGLDDQGNEFWYTGRAGKAWVSANRAEAFVCSREYGQRKARQFNDYTSIHGLRFVAVCPMHWTVCTD